MKRGAVGDYRVVRQGTKLQVYDKLVPNAKQAEFFKKAWNPRYQEVLFHGSVRAGKSLAACRTIVAWAMRYGGTYVVFRYTQQQLEDSTKKIMLRGDGVMAQALPEAFIAARNKEFNMVTLINGAEILFRSMEPGERGKIRNMTLAGAFIDQAEEMEGEGIEDYYEEILGRLSDASGPMRMLLVANPGPETHWLVPRFGLTEETAHLIRPDRAAVHVSLMDNALNLDKRRVKRYLATEETNPDYYKRMVLGLWGVVAGRRFKCWNPQIHVVDDLPFTVLPESWDVYEAGDWGYADPTAWLWAAVDHEGAIWFLHEHYEAEQPVSYHAAAIKTIRKNEDGYLGFQGSLEPSATWLDPSAWNRQRKEISSVAETFREHGIYPARAQNERIGGWTRLEDHLTTVMPDGYGKVRFYRRGCPKAILQIPNLTIKPGTEDVDKRDDHAADSVRYLLMSRPATPAEKRQEEDSMTKPAMIQRLLDRRKALAEGANVVEVA